MQSLKTLNLAFIAMTVLLASCNRSTDFFQSVPGGSEANELSSGENPEALPPAASEEPSPEMEKAPEVIVVKEEEKKPEVVVKPPTEKDICDPLKEEGDEISYGHGLVGKLFDGAPTKIQSFREVSEKGKVIDGSLYMSELNIPTRKFDKGFPRENGTMVMNSMGQVLLENFGIEFTGSFQLQDGDEEGYYEIGLIADDGVSLDILKPEADKNIIDGDHQTPTKFFCSKLLVRMEKNKQVPIRLRYFQGPRYHIALIMMWRKVESLSYSEDPIAKSSLKKPVSETRCGIAGNNFFFDPESASHPQMEYLDLFDKAKRAVPWSIIKHKNLKLPAGYSNMECVDKKP